MIAFYILAALIALSTLCVAVIVYGRNRYFDGYRDGQIDSAYPPSTAGHEVVAWAEEFTREAAAKERG